MSQLPIAPGPVMKRVGAKEDGGERIVVLRDDSAFNQDKQSEARVAVQNALTFAVDANLKTLPTIRV